MSNNEACQRKNSIFLSCFLSKTTNIVVLQGQLHWACLFYVMVKRGLQSRRLVRLFYAKDLTVGMCFLTLKILRVLPRREISEEPPSKQIWQLRHLDKQEISETFDLEKKRLTALWESAKGYYNIMKRILTFRSKTTVKLKLKDRPMYSRSTLQIGFFLLKKSFSRNYSQETRVNIRYWIYFQNHANV